MKDILIRVASPAEDAEALLEIYRPYVIGTAISFEYEVPSLDEFRSRMEATLQHLFHFRVEFRGSIQISQERTTFFTKNN